MLDCKIASVIVTYNRKKLLAESIESLLNQTSQLTKIIIIDNASNDGTEEYLKEKKLFNNIVKYVRLKENLGGSAGFYYGIQYAMEEEIDWICLSDDDAIFEKDFFEKIIGAKKRFTDVLAFTGTVKTNNEIDIVHRKSIKNFLFLTQEGYENSIYKSPFFDIDVFSFVGCVININVIKKVGLPEKDFFIWYDDSEYALRVRKETRIINVSDAVIDHRAILPAKNSNNSYTPNWKEYYGLRNQSFMVIKHTNNKFLACMYIFSKLFIVFGESLVKSKYRGFRKYRVKLLYDVTSSILRNRKGKNNNYLPG